MVKAKLKKRKRQAKEDRIKEERTVMASETQVRRR